MTERTKFAAAQAAQKCRRAMHYWILKFAAAQAAHKRTVCSTLSTARFAAAQAAQKMTSVAMGARSARPDRTIDHFRQRSSGGVVPRIRTRTYQGAGTSAL